MVYIKNLMLNEIDHKIKGKLNKSIFAFLLFYQDKIEKHRL